MKIISVIVKRVLVAVFMLLLGCIGCVVTLSGGIKALAAYSGAMEDVMKKYGL